MEKPENKMPKNPDNLSQKSESKPNETGGFHFEGHIKIHDPETKEVFVDKRNAIHYENMSVAMVQSLSNQGYGTVYQMVFGTGGTNVDPVRNKMEIRHISGATYSDILITCLLDYGEPLDQEAFDNSVDMNGEFVFDELGLKSLGSDNTEGKLITHVIFHPVQKSLNRLLQIDYTIRIQSLTGFTEV